MRKPNSTQPRPIPFLARLLLIAPPAFLLSVKYDAPTYFLIAGLLLVLPVFMKSRLEPKARPLVYFTLAAFALAVLPDLAADVPSERFTASDYFIRAHFTVPFFIYSTAFFCFFRRTPNSVAVAITLALFSGMLCGDLIHTNYLVNVSMPGTTALLRAYRATYAVCACLQCAGVLFALHSEARFASVARLSSKKWFRLCALLSIAVFACGILLLLRSQAQHLEALRHSLRTRMSMRFRYGERGALFGESTRLQHPLPRWLDPSRKRTILRVFSDEPPGYLRINAYPFYMRSGVWQALLDRPVSLQDAGTEDQLATLTFRIPSESKSTERVRMEIRLLPSIWKNDLPMPGNAESVTLDAMRLSVTPDGCFQATDWNVGTGVVVERSSDSFDAPWNAPKLDAESQKDYLGIPNALKVSLTILADMILPKEKRKTMSVRSQAEAVASHLTTHYRYSLDPPGGRGNRDLLMDFLFRRKEGHCQLFASSAALLLRTMGIPTRYVCGVLCTERHPAGYWYATGEDLHSWIEVWLEDEQRWMTLDATPGGGRPPKPEIGFLESGFDWLLLWFDNVAVWFRRGYPTRAIVRIWDSAEAGAAYLYENHPFASAAVLILLYGTFWFVRFRIRCGNLPDRALPRNLRKASRAMRRLERETAKRLGKNRAEWQSYRFWAETIGLPRMKACAIEYERIRFRGGDCSEDELRAFFVRIRCAGDEIKEAVRRRRRRTH